LIFVLRLSQKWIEHLLAQPESGMGYQIVTIKTRGGIVFRQATVDSGHVTRVRGFKDVPFAEDDIEAITVTHDKWDWKTEI
jgi:hypothetical protein